MKRHARRFVALFLLICGVVSLSQCVVGEEAKAAQNTASENDAILRSAAASADAVASKESEAALKVSDVPKEPSTKALEPRAGAKKYEFQAEVSRLMDIIINSLYSNKDIFLRELISNSADALDKLRFVSLTDKSQLGTGDDANLEIQISVADEGGRKVLSIRDRGIGMTRDDLVNNLGTIAKSGTSAFLEQMQKGGDLNLIGQFGVGFYSAYLVADYIEVVSKHNNDTQHIWESGADGAFSISEDTTGEPLGRGTLIKIYLKDEAQEYVQEDKLKGLVSQYSEFINFPIYLWTTEQVEKDVPLTEEELEAQDLERAEKAEKAQAEKAKAQEDGTAEDDDDKEAEDEEELPTTKKEFVKESKWVQLNTQNAIWLREPRDISQADYEKFYQAVSKKPEEKPMTYTHFKAEGDVEFKAVLFVPDSCPADFMDTFYQKRSSIKLYVRRVFISDDFEDLIPRYLRWLVGLVDSDTLPLNVSREMLQAHSSLKTIKKKLVRKALDMIRKVADAQEAAKQEPPEDATEEALAQRDVDKDAYTKLWKEFGKALKMGVVEDAANRQRLAKLLRFSTSTSSGNLTSLEEYVGRMKPDQKNILFIAGQSKEEVENSPFLEKLKRKSYEVIYFIDALDEYVMTNMPEYDGLKFFDASKEDLKIGIDKTEQANDKKVKGEFKALTTWWKEQLVGNVQSVKVSKRLHNTPLIVVTSKFGWSANMERIMKAQAMGDAEKQAYMKGQKTLEINPYHPLIQELKTLHGRDPTAERTQLLAKLLFDTALLESGFQLEDNKAFNNRVYSLVKDVLKIKKDFNSVEDAEAAEAEQAAEEDLMASETADTVETAARADAAKVSVDKNKATDPDVASKTGGSADAASQAQTGLESDHDEL